MKKAVFYWNPKAGRIPLSQRRCLLLVEKLFGQGIDTEVVRADSPEGAVENLRLEGKDLLIVYGGDGTVHSLLPALVGSNLPLALLPSGTANVLARELGIPRDAERALRILQKGFTRRIYLGEGSGRYFHLMAGVGPDSHLISRTSPRLKRSLGVGAYWLAGLRSFWGVPLPDFDVVLDGEWHKASFAVVSNSRYYGGQLLVTPRASVFERCLDVCLFTSRSHARFLAYLLAVLRHQHLDCPDVLYRKVTSVEIQGKEGVPVQMDGEVVGSLPIQVSLFERGIEVFVPKESGFGSM